MCVYIYIRFTLHTTLYTSHLTLRTPHSTLHTPHSELYTRHSTLYISHSAHYTLHSTLHLTPHAPTLYTLHFTLHTLDFTCHTVHCTLYAPHYALQSHSTLSSPHSTLYILHFHLTPSQLYTFHTWLCMEPWPSFIFMLRTYTYLSSSTSALHCVTSSRASKGPFRAEGGPFHLPQSLDNGAWMHVQPSLAFVPTLSGTVTKFWYYKNNAYSQTVMRERATGKMVFLHMKMCRE